MKRKISFLLVGLCLVLSFIFFGGQKAEAKNWMPIVEDMGRSLREAETYYQNDEVKKAKRKVSETYFDLFEGSGMEAAVSLQISEKKNYELESGFGVLRQLIAGHATVSEFRQAREKLILELKKSAEGMASAASSAEKQNSFTALLINALIIILREGFEAILIISALVAYLVKTDHKDKVGRIYLGAGVALVASIATAVVLNSVISISGQAREAMEGITMLIATAVLFYVSYWLISKAESGRWQGFIKKQIDASLSRSSIFALSFAAFLAVYREGAETILFYQALASGADDGDISAIAYGFLIGSLLLLIVYAVIRYTSLRVPLGPFFAVTSTLLYYLAFSFAGRGVLELQEAEWISATPVNIPVIHFLGIYPSFEGLALQAILMMAAGIAGIYLYSASLRTRRQLAAES